MPTKAYLEASKYVSVVCLQAKPPLWTVKLSIQHQSFHVGPETSRAQAIWFGKQLIKALSRIIKLT